MLTCRFLVLLGKGVDRLVVNSPPSLWYQVQGSMFLCLGSESAPEPLRKRTRFSASAASGLAPSQARR